MEKQIISMEAKKNIMAHMENLLDEYDYEYTEPAIKKIINRWAEQKADLINLLSKHPNYVEGEFLIAFNKDWNREINTDGAFTFANWILNNAKIIRENFSEKLKEIRQSELSCSLLTEERFNFYYPLTLNTQFLTNCPRRICLPILKRTARKYS